MQVKIPPESYLADFLYKKVVRGLCIDLAPQPLSAPQDKVGAGAHEWDKHQRDEGRVR